MFKRHVHDNLLLNNDLRLMDDMKKAKLKELSRDRDLFKAKFSKFHQLNSKRHMPEGHYTRNATPKASHKPSFIVCKNSPCSLKSWNNLTDLTKEKVDVYKTEVLQSDEAAVSFRRENKDRNSNAVKNSMQRKISAPPDRMPNGLQLSRSQTTLSKSTDLSDQKSNLETDDFQLPDFRRRSSTMPSYCFRTKLNLGNKRSSPVLENKPQNTNEQKNKIELGNSIPCVSISDHSSENIDKAMDKGLNVTFDLPDEDVERRTAFPKIDKKFQRAKSMIISDNQLSANSPETFRRRSMTVASIRRDNVDDQLSLPQTFRRRSMTVDYSGSPVIRKLLNKRVSIDKFNLTARRQSLFDKLVTASMSSSEDVSDLEYSKSVEDLEACRYLRKPGQNIHGSKEELDLDVIFKQDSE
jgi:hypothetical protein